MSQENWADVPHPLIIHENTTRPAEADMWTLDYQHELSPPVLAFPIVHSALTFATHTAISPTAPRNFNLQNTTALPKSRSQSFVCGVSHSSTRKPKTVGIAGAGLAGLATALTLLKTPGTGVESVSVFEPRESLDTGLGGPLNINGAAAILTKCYGLDIRQIGHRLDAITARAANGRLLFDIDVDKLVKANKTVYDLLTDGTEHLFMTVMRDRFQNLLYEAVRSERIVFHRGPHRKVVQVNQRYGKASFVLASGEESELFDLVVGADGIRSNVRIHVAGKTTPPKYSGLRLQWAVSSQGVSTLQKNCMEQWFGDGGYVLRYAGGPEESPTEALAFTFREDRKAAENAEYKDEDTIQIDLERRLVGCGMPTALSSIVQNATSFIETGIYYHRLLPNWSTGGVCVLVGDAGKSFRQSPCLVIPFCQRGYILNSAYVACIREWY